AGHQALAAGFPLGKRFRSAEVVRLCDGNVEHLGHHARADGRWRIYAFADAPAAGAASALTDWAQWLQSAPDSPVVRYTPDGADADVVFDVKVVYQQRFDETDIAKVPPLFFPKIGPFQLTDWEKVYNAGPGSDICEEREISRDGVVVVVRPDQYVSAIMPLAATDELAAFFAQNMLDAR
ncbi:MAG: 3-hydroxybenzoate 4-monooxygenase, partial [Microbacteriaceae bacterium]